MGGPATARVALALVLLAARSAAVPPEDVKAPRGGDDFTVVATADATPHAAPLDPAKVTSWRAFGSAEGLPQLTVLALAQDTRGFVYAGTQDGLSRYDGRRFEAIELAPGFHGVVGKLLADADGALWVGTDEAGLRRATPDGRIVEVRDANGARLPAIEALHPTAARGTIWTGTPQGLYRCTAGGCSAIPDTADLQVAVLLEEATCLWVGTNLAGLFRFDFKPDGTLERSAFRLTRDSGLPNSAVRALARFGAAPQALYIGTGRGLARWDGTTLTRYPAATGFPPGGVLALAQHRRADGSDELVAANYGSGVLALDADDTYRAYGMNDGLPEAFVYSLLVTGSGAGERVWVGTAGSGLARLDPGRWRTFDQRDGLPQRSVIGVGELALDGGGATIWAGTLGGAVVLDNGRWKPLLPEPYRERVVYDVLRDPAGRLWVATLRGLLMFERGAVHEYTVENSDLPAVSADVLLWRGGTDGELWIGTGHGFARWRGGKLERPYREDSPMDLFGIRALAPLELEGEASAVAVGSATGVIIAHGGDAGSNPAFEQLPAECLAQIEVFDVIPGGPGALWIATREGAVRARRDGAAWKCDRVAEPAAMPRLVYALARDRSGQVYLFGYDGVRRIAHADGPLDDPAVSGYSRYGLDDGLPSLEFNRDALTDRYGRIWAVSSNGLLVIDPMEQAQAPSDAPLVLEAFTGAARLIPGARLAPDHDELRFRFRLLSYVNEHRIRYRSELVGLDRAPTPWSESAERSFHRLAAGSYRLRIGARDAGGAIHGPVEIAFSVAPPWWQHPLALAAAVLLLIAAGVLAGRERARRLAARALALQALVDERTAELAAANRSLERASTADPLTGAGNRRYFYANVGRWTADSAARGGLLLLLIDVDHFKRINDEHGHAAGDAVLCGIARRLGALETARGELVRWGGEEFLLVVREAGDVDPQRFAHAALAAIGAEPLAIDGAALAVTCSIGYTRCLPPGETVASHIDVIIARADRALYRAKDAGRNRAVGAAIDSESGELRFF